jgi:hypothetical protein
LDRLSLILPCISLIEEPGPAGFGIRENSFTAFPPAAVPPPIHIDIIIITPSVIKDAWPLVPSISLFL